MGKIRVATLGDETSEQEQKEKRTRQREEKKKREKIHVPGMKGGERVVTMTSDEEVDKLAKISEEQEKLEKAMLAGEVTREEKKAKKKKVKKKHTKNYRRAFMKVEREKTYAIAEAIKLLREITFTKFDATVEAHINTIEKGLRGSVALPHGTGKKLRIVVLTSTNNSQLTTDNSITAGGDELIERISGGWTDFDILVAHPSFMPNLAKFARILGPKGLMPNPKSGTISDKPEEIAKKLAGGQVQYKSESDFPIIHLVIGKVSFEENKLVENFNALITAIGPTRIKNVTLKSTMSPGIKVSLAPSG